MQVDISSIQVGQAFDFGTIVLDAEEIQSFAQQFDPLPFHTDLEVAAKSRFGGLVASGPHLFLKAYKDQWVPRFGHSVVAGLEISSWKFIRPVYAGQVNHVSVSAKKLQPNPEKGHVVITWRFSYADESGNPIQTAEMSVLHAMGDFS